MNETIIKNIIREEVKKIKEDNLQSFIKTCKDCGRAKESFGDLQNKKETIQYCPDCKRYTNHSITYDSKSKQNKIKESKNITKFNLRSLIKEIINNQKAYSPFSGSVINDICDICGLPLNACPHGENTFVNKVDKDKMAKVSNMDLLKEIIRKEIKSLLSENFQQGDEVFDKKYGNLVYSHSSDEKNPKQKIYYFNKKGHEQELSKVKLTYNDIINLKKINEYRKSKRQLEYEQTYGTKMNRKEEISEVAPPGMEDMVLKLKKKYPKGSASPFKIAWSQYNKKHGKK